MNFYKEKRYRDSERESLTKFFFVEKRWEREQVQFAVFQSAQWKPSRSSQGFREKTFHLSAFQVIAKQNEPNKSVMNCDHFRVSHLAI